MVLAPRKSVILRGDDADLPRDEDGGEQKKEEEPLGEWHQILCCPCHNPTTLLYSMFCCCCAMGDIGCYVHQKWICYPVYCLCASCPCWVGDAREKVAEKFNLPVSEWEPDDCGFCLVKCIGMRLMCFASVCIFPCLHIAQMRAEVAFRSHGKATICPCCCCFCCGGGDGPGAPTAKDLELDYPREDGTHPGANSKENAQAAADYPRGNESVFGLKSKQGAKVVADYPRENGQASARVAKPVPTTVLDYPRDTGEEPVYAPAAVQPAQIAYDYPRSY